MLFLKIKHEFPRKPAIQPMIFLDKPTIFLQKTHRSAVVFSDLLNINDATADDLMKLPGIGRSGGRAELGRGKWWVYHGEAARYCR